MDKYPLNGINQYNTAVGAFYQENDKHFNPLLLSEHSGKLTIDRNVRTVDTGLDILLTELRGVLHNSELLLFSFT